MEFPLQRAIACGAALLLWSGPARAQEPRPERPYRGLFASGAEGWEHLVVVNGQVGAGYDTNFLELTRESAFLIDPLGAAPRRNRGPYGFFTGSLSYSMNLEGAQFGASVSSTARYYGGGAWQLGASASDAGSLGASFDLTPRTKLSAGQSITHQPFSSFTMFPALVPPQLGQAALPEQDYGATVRGYTNYVSNASIERRLSRRAAVTLSYSYQRSHFGSYSVGDDIIPGERYGAHSGMVRFTRGITRNLGLRLGYGYTEGRYRRGELRAVRGHTIDSGVDYNRTLAFSRRTTLSFGTGAAVLRDAFDTRYTVVGNVNFSRELRRTWSLNAAFHRNVAFVETLDAPALYDGVNVALAGLIGRRVSFNSGLGAMVGAIGVSRDVQANNGFDTYYASATLGFALTRHLGVGTNYSFYRYGFERTAALPPGFSRELDRHSVRVYLSMWAPVFSHGRKPDAAR